MNLSVLLLFVFVVGVYSNCGCLSCNKHFHVLSPPGARVKIIHRNRPCSCPTSIPYSVEVPVSYPERWGRSYGYEVQAERFKLADPAPDPCPLEQEYDCRMQVPRESRPRYLVGLLASTDRIVLESPPQRPLHKLCQRPTLERISDIPLQRYGSGADERDQRTIWKPVTNARSKRSINYKLLALNSNNFQLSNKRKGLQSRKFSQQKNKTPFLMTSDDPKRSSILGLKRKLTGRRRYRRDLFESEEDDENEIEEKPKSKKRLNKDESVPMMFQSMPILKMLSFPLKYLGHIHDNPIVGAIPKVLRVSRRYLMEFAKGFVDDYKRMRRRKVVGKRLNKRDCGCSKWKREISQMPVQQLVVGVIEDLAKKTQRTKRSGEPHYEFADVSGMSWDEIVTELQKIVSDNSGGENKAVAKEFLSILKELSNGPRNKREATFLGDVLKLLKAERLSMRTKRSVPDLETNTVNDEIQRTTKYVQKLIERDIFEEVRIYEHLLKLQNFKRVLAKHPQQFKAGQELKDLVLQEIIAKINENEDENLGKWIKTIILLQKFHYALQLLEKDRNSPQAFVAISSIEFVKARNRRDLLLELKRRQGTEMQVEVEFLNGLKLLAASKNESKIREEGALIWQSNNLKKLQRDSIVKIVEKLVKKLRIRQELKILFDLQKQLEDCRDKQTRLFDEAITSRLPHDRNLRGAIRNMFKKISQ